MAVCALVSLVFGRISRTSFIPLAPIFVGIAFPWLRLLPGLRVHHCNTSNRNGRLGTELFSAAEILIPEREVTLGVGEIQLRPGARSDRARSPLSNHLRFAAIVSLACELALLLWTVQIVVLLRGWKPRRLGRPL